MTTDILARQTRADSAPVQRKNQKDALREKAGNLAFRSTWPDLADLVWLEPEAHEVLDFLESGVPLTARAAAHLGISDDAQRENFRLLLREFLADDRAKALVDCALELLYQGQEAQKAGLPAEAWLKAHLLTHIGAVRVLRHFETGRPLDYETWKFLHFDDSGCHSFHVREFAETEATPEARRGLTLDWEHRLKLREALRLLAEASPAPGEVLPAPQVVPTRKPTARIHVPRRTARIPLSHLRVPVG